MNRAWTMDALLLVCVDRSEAAMDKMLVFSSHQVEAELEELLSRSTTTTITRTTSVITTLTTTTTITRWLERRPPNQRVLLAASPSITSILKVASFPSFVPFPSDSPLP